MFHTIPEANKHCEYSYTLSREAVRSAQQRVTAAAAGRHSGGGIGSGGDGGGGGGEGDGGLGGGGHGGGGLGGGGCVGSC